MRIKKSQVIVLMDDTGRHDARTAKAARLFMPQKHSMRRLFMIQTSKRSSPARAFAQRLPTRKDGRIKGQYAKCEFALAAGR